MAIRHLLAPLALSVALAGSAHADEPGMTASGQDNDVVSPVFDHAVPNIPGKSMVALEVSYPPSGATPPHRHAPSAFIMAYVLSGAIRSQLEGEPPHVYHAGETWYEDPGAHHVMSENASMDQPARILAVFVVDSALAPLTSYDADPGGTRD